MREREVDIIANEEQGAVVASQGLAKELVQSLLNGLKPGPWRQRSWYWQYSGCRCRRRDLG
jgi:hypothetical protein